jgi:hypothetical protein
MTSPVTFHRSRGSERHTMKHRAIMTFVLTLVLTFGSSLTTQQVEAKPSSKYPCPQWHDLMRKHGLPVKTFAPIMWRESKCQKKAVGWNYHKGKSHRDCKLSHARTYRKCKAVRSYDVGLLQINSSWKSLTAKVCKTTYGKMLVLQDPDCNLRVAAVLYNNGKGLVNWKGTSGQSKR